MSLIDTAEAYGPYVSEELIAEALYPYPAGLVIATKCGLDRPGPDSWTPNGRPERLRDALHGSLKRLRVDRIDLYQLHRMDPAVPQDDQFGFLRDAQQAGKIRHAGLSEVDVPQIERARRTVSVVSVQNRYNVEDRHWESVVEYCEREGIAFLPWAPLEAGSMARRGLRQMARRLLGHASRQHALERVARRHRATPAQIALAWLLHRSPVMLPIPGTSRTRHLEENAASARIELSPDDLAALA